LRAGKVRAEERTFTPCKASTAGAKSDRAAGFEKFSIDQSAISTVVRKAFRLKVPAVIALSKFL
jgi:hypothetical protein